MPRFANLAAVVVSVVLTLGACELALRWLGWGPNAAAGHARLLRFDPAIGWTKAPNASVTYRWMGSRIVETTNSFGGRGPEPGAAQERVLFLGDSFCEGYLVNDDEVFSAVFARRQSRFAPVNLGVAGYSTDQALLLYQRLAGQLRPQRVVLLFFDNDVWFNSVTVEHRAPKPAFALTPTGLQLTGTPVPPPAQRAAAAPCADCPPSWRLLQLFAQARSTVAPAGKPALAPELLAYRRTAPPELDAAWQLTEALLAALQKATGHRLTVFYVPTVAAIYDSSWAATKQIYGMDDNWDIHLPASKLAEVCARQSIPLLSPTSRLRERAARGETLYFLEDGHWNREGHRLVGEMLADSLLSSSSQRGSLP